MAAVVSGTDDRKIAVYARKSKITETGKSIENQISKCKSYADLKFDAHEEDILVYRDEGLSGFYSDRPQYMQMLQDIKDNRVKAVICYKFDRISRRTVDLLNLVEQLRQKKIAFVSCTDEVDTSTRTGKIVMSLLASIAEFERDIIAERISDNMYELAKDGRWLGGITPTGFSSQKEHMNVNGKKTTVNHLEPIPEEQSAVKEIFRRFIACRSVARVVEWLNSAGIQTKTGKAHTRVSVKDILSNPVYASADGDTYAYFSAFGVPIYAEKAEFDGKRGLMIYNKTEQLKELRDESTIAHPVYVRKGIRRGVGDWIISVGRHGGIIAGRDWVLVQKILEDNRDRHKRPKEKTQSLLSGLIACPFCGKNMYVHRETGRFTDGKPRFLYKCQTKRGDKSACSCRDVKGNAIDRFVLDAVCSMSGEWEDEYYRLLEEDTLAREKTDGIKTELFNIDKMIDRCRNEIQNQTKSLRLASEASREFIMEDMNKLLETLKQYEADKKRLLSIKESRGNETETFEKAKKLISSFSCLMEELTYREKAEFLRIAVERVYVLPGEAGEDEVHIFMKGTPAKSLAGGCAGAQ